MKITWQKMLISLVILVIVLLMLNGCHTTPRTSAGIAIDVMCREWGRSLPSRSRQDTPETQAEISTAYNVFEAACGMETHE